MLVGPPLRCLPGSSAAQRAPWLNALPRRLKTGPTPCTSPLTTPCAVTTRSAVTCLCCVMMYRMTARCTRMHVGCLEELAAREREVAELSDASLKYQTRLQTYADQVGGWAGG